MAHLIKKRARNRNSADPRGRNGVCQRTAWNAPEVRNLGPTRSRLQVAEPGQEFRARISGLQFPGRQKPWGGENLQT